MNSPFTNLGVSTYKPWYTGFAESYIALGQTMTNGNQSFKDPKSEAITHVANNQYTPNLDGSYVFDKGKVEPYSTDPILNLENSRRKSQPMIEDNPFHKRWEKLEAKIDEGHKQICHMLEELLQRREARTQATPGNFANAEMPSNHFQHCDDPLEFQGSPDVTCDDLFNTNSNTMKTLEKAEPIQWTSLEFNREITIPQKVDVSSVITAQKPVYPSSKPKKVDLDKLETQVKEEKDEKLDVDEDTRRAMQKSFVESYGTMISTDWKEVGAKRVEGSASNGNFVFDKGKGGHIEICKFANPQPAIAWASSSSFYGFNTKVPCCEKYMTDQPASLYVATKKVGEEIAHTYNNIYGLSLISSLRMGTQAWKVFDPGSNIAGVSFDIFGLHAESSCVALVVVPISSMRVDIVLVFLGYLSYVLLSKPAKGAKKTFFLLSLLPKILHIYKEVISELKATGAPWIQFDEPTLVLDLDSHQSQAPTAAYTGLELNDIDLFEINEVFAYQFVYCRKKLELDLQKVNVNGSAMAIGHPLGATEYMNESCHLPQFDHDLALIDEEWEWVLSTKCKSSERLNEFRIEYSTASKKNAELRQQLLLPGTAEQAYIVTDDSETTGNDKSSSDFPEITIGIDIGTSQCNVAIQNGLQVKLFKNTRNHELIRSYVTFKDKIPSSGVSNQLFHEHEMLFGAASFNMKRLVGTVLHSSKYLHFLVQTLEIDVCPFIAALVNNVWRSTTTEEVLAIFLVELRVMAEVQLKIPIRNVWSKYSLNKQRLHAVGLTPSTYVKASTISCIRIFECFFSRLMDVMGLSIGNYAGHPSSYESILISKRFNRGALYLSIELLSACRDLIASSETILTVSAHTEETWYHLLQRFLPSLTNAFCSTFICTCEDLHDTDMYLGVKGLLILATLHGGYLLISKTVFEKVLVTFVPIVNVDYRDKLLWNLALKARVQIGSFITETCGSCS